MPPDNQIGDTGMVNNTMLGTTFASSGGEGDQNLIRYAQSTLSQEDYSNWLRAYSEAYGSFLGSEGVSSEPAKRPKLKKPVKAVVVITKKEADEDYPAHTLIQLKKGVTEIDSVRRTGAGEAKRWKKDFEERAEEMFKQETHDYALQEAGITEQIHLSLPNTNHSEQPNRMSNHHPNDDGVGEDSFNLDIDEEAMAKLDEEPEEPERYEIDVPF